MMCDPTSPTTPSAASSTPLPIRRRGLSYLRNYTHHRLSSLAGQSSEPSSTSFSASSEGLFRTTSTPAQPASSSAHTAHPENPPEPSPTENHYDSSDLNAERQRPSADSSTTSAVNSALGGISRIMARHRVASATQATNRRTTSEAGTTTTLAANKTDAGTGLTGYPLDQMPTIRLIPHQDPRSTRPSLTFPPMSRTLPHEDCVIRVGRYSERDANPNPPPNVPSSAPVGFKSKVVSRRHCEFWCSNGQWYIKDVKSSSGTFLNHIRLSQPSVESRPWPVNDGDVVQLGIDFRGGEEMIFRCVKIRVECNRGWQKSLNNFKYVDRSEAQVIHDTKEHSVTTHKRLIGKPVPKKDTDTASSHSSECSICLMSIAVSSSCDS